MLKEGAGGACSSPQLSTPQYTGSSQAQTSTAPASSLSQPCHFSQMEQLRHCQIGKVQFCPCYLFRSLVTALPLTKDEHLLLLYLYFSVIHCILNVLKFFFRVVNEHSLSGDLKRQLSWKENHDKIQFCFLVYLHLLSKRNVVRLESNTKSTS